MAYRAQVSLRQKSAAIAAVVAVHAALLLALLNLPAKIDLGGAQSVLQIINVRELLPRPPPAPRRRQPERKRKHGGSSAPKNIKSEATPVAAPKPRIETPPVQRIPVSDTPRQGTAPTQGAAAEHGPGTAAGGLGSGTGSGAGGSGQGSGQDGGIAEPPRLASPVLSGRDFPRGLLRQWPRGTTVFLRLRVDAHGAVAECMIDRGTGVPAVDGAMCNLAHDRLRFRPAVNRSGQAVAGWFGYAQPAPR